MFNPLGNVVAPVTGKYLMVAERCAYKIKYPPVPAMTSATASTSETNERSLAGK